jgi:hypothetical protein
MVAGLKAARDAEAQAQIAEVMRELHDKTERAAPGFGGGAATLHCF